MCNSPFISHLLHFSLPRSLCVEAIDIPRFRQLHSDVCEKLVALCNVWEDKMDELEQSDSEGLEEGL